MDERPSIRITDSPSEADYEGIILELFEDGADVKGWYIGPVESSAQGGIKIPYLAKSRRVSAAGALVSAMGLAMVSRSNICILDPLHLWALV